MNKKKQRRKKAKKHFIIKPLFDEKNNTIQHLHPSTFEHFFSALNDLKSKRKEKVQILHLGDSHIQAEFFPWRVREHFQADSNFGFGGRGFLFPYRLAKTSHSSDFQVLKTGNWSGCRNISASKFCHWGIAGITSFTEDSFATFTIQKYPGIATNLSTQKVKVYFPKSSDSIYTISLETEFEIINQYKYDSNLELAEFQLNTNAKVFKFLVMQKSTQKGVFILQGLEFVSDTPGILYSSVGVNGAEVPSFLKCPYLTKNLQAIQPDLIVISLGTNDGFAKKFNPNAFEENLGHLVQRLRMALPSVSILLTTPGDNFGYGRKPNARNLQVSDIIKRIAEETDCAIWDFHSIMGGMGAIKNWKHQKMAQKDLVHFTVGGYRLQGDLLYKALKKAIQPYQE